MNQLKIIARIRSDFPEKFGIPRQSGVVPETRAKIVFEPEYRKEAALRGIEGFSHLWLIWGFSECERDSWSPTVRPPRLGGNTRMGVFATRATHRPNGIGQSVVKLDKVEANRLWISGIDLLDGTPILDIKPYVPYADIISDASNGMASAAPVLIPVQWADSALQQAHREALRLQEPLVELIEQCLAQDPRPAYQTPTAEREYGAQFWDLDVRWHYPEPGLIRVLEVTPKP